MWKIDHIRADIMQLGVSNCHICYGNYVNIHNIKPYLLPMSSMTAGQKREYAHITAKCGNVASSQLTGMTVQDWFDKNHFDYQGLIPMELAIDATGLGIY